MDKFLILPKEKYITDYKQNILIKYKYICNIQFHIGLSY